MHAISSAPAGEDLLVALANTAHGTEDDPGAQDELRDPASARAWWSTLVGRVPDRFGTTEDVAMLRSARTLIRELGLRNNGVAVVPEVGALATLSLTFALDDSGPNLAVRGGSTPARDLAARAVLELVRLQSRSTFLRFKACPGPDCGWVFRDTTRNGSRRWCDMAACGNRAKAASFRARAH